MSKRFHISMVVVAVLLVPSVIFASVHKLAISEPVAKDNVIVVPLIVTNETDLTAIDMPLKFSEGVTLLEVDFDFDDCRVSYFDLKAANINNEKRTVVIGLLPQLTPTHKPNLEAGTGPVANLVFEIDDPSVTEITIEAVQLQDPDHSLLFIYHDFDQNAVPHNRVEEPEFAPVTVAVRPSGGPEVPDVFALNQNYPNPFNPSTEISFDLPVASHVELTVYNILGQNVETLVDRQMEAGRHTVSWEASKYSSGVYFYRISAKDFSETKKMLMLK